MFESLLEYRRFRASAKARGLGGADAPKRLLPSVSTVIGLIRHLTGVEWNRFREVLGDDSRQGAALFQRGSSLVSAITTLRRGKSRLAEGLPPRGGATASRREAQLRPRGHIPAAVRLSGARPLVSPAAVRLSGARPIESPAAVWLSGARPVVSPAAVWLSGARPVVSPAAVQLSPPRVQTWGTRAVRTPPVDCQYVRSPSKTSSAGPLSETCSPSSAAHIRTPSLPPGSSTRHWFGAPEPAQ